MPADTFLRLAINLPPSCTATNTYSPSLDFWMAAMGTTNVEGGVIDDLHDGNHVRMEFPVLRTQADFYVEGPVQRIDRASGIIEFGIDLFAHVRNRNNGFITPIHLADKGFGNFTRDFECIQIDDRKAGMPGATACPILISTWSTVPLMGDLIRVISSCS